MASPLPLPKKPRMEGGRKKQLKENFHKRLQRESKDLLRNALDKAYYVSPTQLIKVHPRSIPAGNLTIGMDSDHHFTMEPLKQFLDGPNVVLQLKDEENLKNSDKFQCYFKKLIDRKRTPEVWFFERRKVDIMTKLDYYDGEIQSEAQLRYIVGDPLLSLMCERFDLQARLEESVSKQLEQQSLLETGGESLSVTPIKYTRKEQCTPGRATTLAVTTKSRPDYTGYYVCSTLREGDKGDKIVAVIIETKLLSNEKYVYAVAQAIGYHIALLTEKTTPPLVFVLSEEYLEIILFPFQDGQGNPLINAVRLDKISLWKETDEFDINVMQILFTFLERTLHSDDPMFSTYQPGPLFLTHDSCVPKRSLRHNVQTWKRAEAQEIETLKQALQQETKDKEAALKEKEAALMDIEAALKDKEAALKAALMDIEAALKDKEAALKEKEAALKQIRQLTMQLQTQRDSS